MERIKKVKAELEKAVKGKGDVLDAVLMAVLAGGHILMEDIPGVGKTTLAVALSRAMGLEYKRVQFTPDVLPGDLTGFTMYNNKTGEFEYKNGALMCNLLLADEINRASSKTQSALLEAMEEGRVTVDSVTKKLPDPFITVATQNPFGSAGTQRLPQSQIERFMVRVSMGYPSPADEVEILRADKVNKLEAVEGVLKSEDIAALQKVCFECYVKDNILEYIVKLSNATRDNIYISTGISPRGSIALLKMAKAHACISGRDYVTRDDVIKILPYTAYHRIQLSNEARINKLDEKKVFKGIIGSIA